ncbi:MAG: hypothetical protein AVO39_03285 [delta proteobacterium MLS_D]|jgi:drug/metabolite transporter (DMT)-like permease|nr:MAG: hypothetical protein AVO39_03285 [delta proteobacterium MLS_D]
MLKKLGADGLLLAVTVFWGLTFVIVKEAVEVVGVFLFLSQRFILAFIIMAGICVVARRPISGDVVLKGLTLGALLFGAFAFQTAALAWTTASNTAFLTGLNVLFVSIISGVFLKQRLTGFMIAGVIMASVGLFFLCTGGRWVANVGDLLALTCAVFIALHVVFTGRYARLYDVYWLTAVQLGVVALLSTGGAVVAGDGNSIVAWHPEILNALVICVLFATVFAFFVQTSMQRFTTPTHTALIFCMEPVFGALFAAYALNERLGSGGLFGASLILVGMILSEVSFPSRFRVDTPKV